MAGLGNTMSHREKGRDVLSLNVGTVLGYYGQDQYGKFKLIWDDCIYCNSTGQVCIEYFSPKFPQDIKVEKTILQRPRGHLGVTCGCYGKLHRQIAHIVHKMVRR